MYGAIPGSSHVTSDASHLENTRVPIPAIGCDVGDDSVESSSTVHVSSVINSPNVLVSPYDL